MKNRQKGIADILTTLGLTILVLVIPLTVKLVEQRQETRKQAYTFIYAGKCVGCHQAYDNWGEVVDTESCGGTENGCSTATPPPNTCAANGSYCDDALPCCNYDYACDRYQCVKIGQSPTEPPTQTPIGTAICCGCEMALNGAGDCEYSSGKCLFEGLCRTTDCRPGEKVCGGSYLWTCDSGGWSWDSSICPENTECTNANASDPCTAVSEITTIPTPSPITTPKPKKTCTTDEECSATQKCLTSLGICYDIPISCAGHYEYCDADMNDCCDNWACYQSQCVPTTSQSGCTAKGGYCEENATICCGTLYCKNSECTDLSETTASPKPTIKTHVCPPGCCNPECGGNCPGGQSCDVINGACSVGGMSCNPLGSGTHLACVGGLCIHAPGEGKDECSSNEYCKANQKQLCEPNSCCGLGLKCNPEGTACNVTGEKAADCDKTHTGWVCSPNFCCAEGKACNAKGSACNVANSKCTAKVEAFTQDRIKGFCKENTQLGNQAGNKCYYCDEKGQVQELKTQDCNVNNICSVLTSGNRGACFPYGVNLDKKYISCQPGSEPQVFDSLEECKLTKTDIKPAPASPSATIKYPTLTAFTDFFSKEINLAILKSIFPPANFVGNVSDFFKAAYELLFGVKPETPTTLTPVTTLSDITNKHSNKCLDLDGDKVVQNTCSNSSSQNWVAVPVGDGYYQIIDQESKKCLDVNDGMIVQSDCSEAARQLWQLKQSGENYLIINKQSGKCLDDKQMEKKENWQMIEWDCNNGNNQLWGMKIESTSAPSGFSPNTYKPGAVNLRATGSFNPATDENTNALVVRGYTDVTSGGNLTLVGYTSSVDPKALKLDTLIEDHPDYQFVKLYQIPDPDNSNNPGVNLVGIKTQAGEVVDLPQTGIYGDGTFNNPYNIGGGYQGMVAYICPDGSCITVNYVPNDFVGGVDPTTGKPIQEYAIYLQGIQVDPALKGLYDSLNSQGRLEMPVLNGGQAIGVTSGTELKVSIGRDGNFADPRSKDWWVGGDTEAPEVEQATPAKPPSNYIPPTTSNNTYQTATVLPSKDKVAPNLQPDINPLDDDLRGYELIKSVKSGSLDGTKLIDYKSGPNFDPDAPKLDTLLDDHTQYTFTNFYEIYDWNWSKNKPTGVKGTLETNKYPVNLAGISTDPGEEVLMPQSGKYDAKSGNFQLPARKTFDNGNTGVVLYVCPDRSCITIQSVPDAFIGSPGYTYHLEGLRVDENLAKLYEQNNSTNTTKLPALKPSQQIGVTSGSEIKVALRDNGVLQDPRSQDYWTNADTKAPVLK
ncbi:MAG: RICIN domain-containing protein [Candidatus Gottesmanbacteria bacterium]